MQTYRVRLGQFDQRDGPDGHAGEVEAVQRSALAADAMTPRSLCLLLPLVASIAHAGAASPIWGRDRSTPLTGLDWLGLRRTSPETDIAPFPARVEIV